MSRPFREPPALRSSGQVDLCAQASLGVIDFEYCGADIPTCEGTTTLGVGDIIPPPTDGDAIKTLLNKLICFLFCYDLGFQLLPPELQCSEAKNVNELLGAPPIEIVPYAGRQLSRFPNRECVRVCLRT